MLEVFLGGYLFHPAALDYSGDTCRNGCAYCFANINKEAREGNLKGAINALYKPEPTTYRDMLLVEGYPICVSNRSDPFTARNRLDSIALFTHLAERKGGVFIQTKTGPGMDECLALMGGRRDVVVYITITSMRDEIAAVVEPNAPPPSARLATAKRLHKAGYLVLLAVNPCTEAWMPRTGFESFCREMKKAGLRHICLEILDLKRKRIKLLSERKKRMLGEQALDDCASGRVYGYVRECTEYLVSQGFAVAKKGMPFRSTLFDDCKARLGRTMPVLQDFVNHCFDKYGESEAVISYPEFESIIAREGIFLRTVRQNNIRDYLLRSGFISWKANQQVHSHKELLRICWNDPRHKLSVQNHCMFRVIGRNGNPDLDENGNVRLFWDGKPHLGKKGVIAP